jgi:hypothetical protein
MTEKKVHHLMADDFIVEPDFGGEWHAMDSFPQDGAWVIVREFEGGPTVAACWDLLGGKMETTLSSPQQWRRP